MSVINSILQEVDNNRSDCVALWIVLLSFWLFPQTKIVAQDFEATGIFRSEAFSLQYKNGEEPCLIIEGNFVAAVQGCQSEVQYTPTNIVFYLKQFESNEAGAILAFDGTNYYQLLIANTNLQNGKQIIPSGKISRGPVPEREDEKLATLWLAFASQCYFKDANSNLIYSPFMNPPVNRSVWDGDHRVRASWSRLPGFPGLPAHVVHSPKFVSQDSSSSVTSNIVYNVSAVTNYEGLLLPRKFEYKLYFPLGRLLDSFSAELKTVRLETHLRNFTPMLPKRTIIVDERFITRTGNPVSVYAHESSNWPTLEEGETNLSGSREPSEESVQLHQNNAARSITLIVLGSLMLVPIVLLIKKTMHK